MTTKSIFHGILFDMDGTLADSTNAVNATFDAWCERLQLDPVHFKHISHGVRLYDTISYFYQQSPVVTGSTLSASQLQNKVDEFEAEIISRGQKLNDAGLKGHAALPGVRDLLAKLQSSRRKDGLQYHALVTSATARYAMPLMEMCGLPMPDEKVSGDQVQKGKPDPEPYLVGAARLGLRPEDCLCVEDAPAGVASGKAAGCKVLAVCTSHTKERMQATEADWVVNDLTEIDITIDQALDTIELTIHHH